MTTDPGANESRKRLHVARIPMRWRDMDINRHVNNTVYFRYFEQARIEWCDIARAAWGHTSQSFVIGSARLATIESPSRIPAPSR